AGIYGGKSKRILFKIVQQKNINGTIPISKSKLTVLWIPGPTISAVDRLRPRTKPGTCFFQQMSDRIADHAVPVRPDIQQQRHIPDRYIGDHALYPRERNQLIGVFHSAGISPGAAHRHTFLPDLLCADGSRDRRASLLTLEIAHPAGPGVHNNVGLIFAHEAHETERFSGS